MHAPGVAMVTVELLAALQDLTLSQRNVHCGLLHGDCRLHIVTGMQNPNVSDGPLRFRHLLIGQTFDFVDDSRPQPNHNSFYARVVKTGTRNYMLTDAPHTTYQVGSINASVYHVGASVAWETHS